MVPAISADTTVWLWSGIWSVGTTSMASKLESDLWDTVDWDRKWLVDLNAGKTQLVSFECSHTTGSIDVKMAVSFWGNQLLRCWSWLSLPNWIGALTLSLLLKLPFFLLGLLCISINLPYKTCMKHCCHVWAGAPSCYLELFDKLQKWTMTHWQNVASLSLFYR